MFRRDPPEPDRYRQPREYPDRRDRFREESYHPDRYINLLPMAILVACHLSLSTQWPIMNVVHYIRESCS